MSSSNHIVGADTNIGTNTGTVDSGSDTNGSVINAVGSGSSSLGSNDSSDSDKVPCVTVQTSDPVLWMTTLVAPPLPP